MDAKLCRSIARTVQIRDEGNGSVRRKSAASTCADSCRDASKTESDNEGSATVMELDDLKRPGGTSGGVIEFVVGLVMTISGAYMLISRVVVASGFWNWGGYNSFGLSLVPLVLVLHLFSLMADRSSVGY